MIRLGSFLAAIILPTGLAFGQAVTEVSQVSDGRPSVAVDSLPSAESTEQPAQVSHDIRNPTAETQLTAGQASRQQPAQLSNDRPSAQGAQPLSRPSDGRTAAVEHVQGKDRCDPANSKAKQSETCKQVLETRADDYTRPHPTELTPEQRLLLDQELEHAGETVADATRRLATSGETDDSNDAMGIAAIVLRQNAPRTEPKPDKAQDPATDAAVQAIVQIITQAPPH